MSVQGGCLRTLSKRSKEDQMRLFLQTVLAVVAIVASTLLTVFGLVIMFSNPVNKLGKMIVVAFATMLALLVLNLILSMMKRDRLILQIVGILPGRIDEWKWRQLAVVRVENSLHRLAVRIRDLDKEERDLLSKISAPSDKILEMHKEIKGILREFREIHDVFVGFDFKLKDSWNDYVS